MQIKTIMRYHPKHVRQLSCHLQQYVDLEIMMLSKARQRETSYDTTSMQNVKKKKKERDTNELICKTETDPQNTNTLMVTKGGKEGGINWKLTDIHHCI